MAKKNLEIYRGGGRLAICGVRCYVSPPKFGHYYEFSPLFHYLDCIEGY